jgi:hypothetical protein
VPGLHGPGQHAAAEQGDEDQVAEHEQGPGQVVPDFGAPAELSEGSSEGMCNRPPTEYWKPPNETGALFPSDASRIASPAPHAAKVQDQQQDDRDERDQRAAERRVSRVSDWLNGDPAVSEPAARPAWLAAETRNADAPCSIGLNFREPGCIRYYNRATEMIARQ